MDGSELGTVEMNLGESFKIAFNEASGAGYVWEISHDQEAFSITDSREGDNDDSIGGGVRRIFEIHAKKPGEFSIEFTHKRPFEGRVRETAVITIKVKSKPELTVV